MKILAVDDEAIALKNLELKIHKCLADAEVWTFNSAKKTLDWLPDNDIDVAFLDINMAEMDGLNLAGKIREVKPYCPIIFVTGHSEYAIPAFKIKATGYLVKPIEVSDLKKELEFIQNSTADDPADIKGMYVKCFGNFDVFAGGKVVEFHRKKSKEIFAYLVDRNGSTATMQEISSVLWEDEVFDESKRNQIHTFLHDLIEDLKAVNMETVLIKKRNAVCVDKSKFKCDYYDFLNGDEKAENLYTGEYMSQYWWAEITGGKLAFL